MKFFYHDVDAPINKMVTMLNAREHVIFGVELEGGYYGDERFVCGFVELLAATVQELTQTPTGLTCFQYAFRRSPRMPKALVQRSAELLRQYGPPKEVPQGLGWLRDDVTKRPEYLLPLRINDWDVAAIDLVTIGSGSPYASGPFFLRPGVRW